ncbi:anti-sigma factor domain-containing protein [Microbacterium sp. P07]|uniref:anti-sigma factor n=1 Tax=Microbacterium sp. P07 TaxID=3366952 RepID=UPI0037455848
MNENTFAELAAGYALSALSPSDLLAFDAALAEHPEWEKHVRTEADTVALLADSVAPVAPPAALRDALMARIALTPQTTDAADEEDFAAAGPAPAVTPVRAPSGGMRRRWFTLAASIVAVLALGFGAVTISQQLTRPAAVVALEQIENAADAQSATVPLTDGGEATAHWSSELGEVVIVSDGLPALASDETFELWFVRDGAAVSAGVFDANDGSATALLAGTYQPGDVIAVTVEPDGGSPSGAPTSEPILAIATA